MSGGIAAASSSAALQITYPFDGAIFPPEIIPPVISWNDKSNSDSWRIKFEFKNSNGSMDFTSSLRKWQPPPEKWVEIKRLSTEKKARLVIVGYKNNQPGRTLSKGSISISTSKDKVGAPIFYREVNLPFAEAVKYPAKHISWRFGTIDTEARPRIVLDKLPVCGNCHSFSNDGSTLGLDVDYANDKGSYAIAPVEEEIRLDRPRLITWSDYKREEKEGTFGLLSQVSPTGRFVVSTVKDLSVFIPKPELDFSQIFFPIKGIMVIYNREKKSFSPLPGADDRDFFHGGPSWSPDGKYLVFSRTRAYTKKLPIKTNPLLLTPEQMKNIMAEFKTWKYDLYRIPFNNGLGGAAKPLAGASNNGMSNFFPKYSPDGKWIIFCKARNYMLLQPESELFIIPATGGEARRLRCNTKRMNSWHSWSPNSRWLVFSSKLNGPYTQLFLTHIDVKGESSPPVVLENFTSKNRAANIPEFVNTRTDGIKKIGQEFVDDDSWLRAGFALLKVVDDNSLHKPEKLFHKALAINPSNSNAYHGLGMLDLRRKKANKAEQHFIKAIELEPNNAEANNALGLLMGLKGEHAKAEKYFLKAVSVASHSLAFSERGRAGAYMNLGRHYLSTNQLNSAEVFLLKGVDLESEFAPMTHHYLGRIFARKRDYINAIKHLKKAMKIVQDTDEKKKFVAIVNSFLGGIYLHEMNDLELAIKHFNDSVKQHPRPATVYNSLGIVYARKGDLRSAVNCWQKALSIEPNNRSARGNLARVNPEFFR
ncbi:tetratricopeptide repeat protein [Candidatus Riflebacteria bacterium]